MTDRNPCATILISDVQKTFLNGDRNMEICKAWFMIAILLVFIGFTVRPMPAADIPENSQGPAKTKWISSTDLLKTGKFVDLSKSGQERLAHVWSDISVGPDTGWKIHKGDLAINGSFDNTDPLVVDGNLTVKGSYDDYRSGMGHLVVLGDFHVENVLSNDDLYVQGRLAATGVVFTYYNDFHFTVGGGVDGKGLIVDDKASSYVSGNLGFVIDTFGNSAEHHDLALRSMAPEMWLNPDHIEEGVDALIEICEEWDEISGIPDRKLISSYIEEGRPIFRKKPAPAELADKICQALDLEKFPESSVPALAAYDPLVNYALAARTDLSEKAYQTIGKGKDPVALAILMTHRKVDTSVDVGRLSINEARVLAKREDTPDEVVARLARLDDTRVLKAVSLRDDLPVPVLEEIIYKGIDSLTERILRGDDNAFRLPQKTKKMLFKKAKTKISVRS